MKENKSIRYIVIAIVLILIAIFILFFINGRETRISGEYDKNIISSLHCTTGGREDAFFSPSLVNTINNEIKITYKNDKLDKLFYTYIGIYRSNDVAKNDEAILHAKYNIYLGQNNIPQESIVSSFFVTNTKLHIDLYTDKYTSINSATSNFFFIDKDKINEFEVKSIEEAKDYYEEKGFNCSINR